MHTHLQYDLGGLCYVLLEDVIRPGWVSEYACTAATQRKGTADERCIVGEAGFKGNGGAAACDGIRGKFGLGEIRRKNENWGRRAEQSTGEIHTIGAVSSVLKVTEYRSGMSAVAGILLYPDKASSGTPASSSRVNSMVPCVGN